MTLSELRKGREVVVRRVGGDRALAVRLMELGLVPGAVVWVVRIAPLGDPMVIALRGAELSVRRSEALLIEIGEAE